MTKNIKTLTKLIQKILDIQSVIDNDFVVNPRDKLDSLSIVRLILAIEEKYNVSLNIDFFSKPKTISDIMMAISDDT
jgi:acyl carrier protein